MRYSLKESRLVLRNSTTRIPFRYGAATLRRCPQSILEVAIEAEGRIHRGWSGDCLPPGWFDKTPDRSYRDQIADMIASIRLARSAFADRARLPVSFFESWIDANLDVRKEAAARGLNPLLASFGISMVERAVMDALARAGGLSFADAVRKDLFGIDLGAADPSTSGTRPAEWLPRSPRPWVYVRHTVGLGDPLPEGEIPEGDRVDDGLPQALETYVERLGLRYLKIKLSADPEADRARLLAIAEVVERSRGPDYALTLDGNEQFKGPDALLGLFEDLRGEARLQTLLGNVIAVEQPLERGIALDDSAASGVRTLSSWRPVIIDESDGTTDAYQKALEVGYRGVSSKNCKGPTKAILNAGLTWLRNERGRRSDYLMTGEDLCSVGVVPVQADLCLAATLGLEHVERNGHHYHPGLSYLPEDDRRAALAAHPDFYRERGGIIGPEVRDGRFEIGSVVGCSGFGFAAVPDLDSYETEERWSYDSLGLDG